MTANTKLKYLNKNNFNFRKCKEGVGDTICEH